MEVSGRWGTMAEAPRRPEEEEEEEEEGPAARIKRKICEARARTRRFRGRSGLFTTAAISSPSG